MAMGALSALSVKHTMDIVLIWSFVAVSTGACSLQALSSHFTIILIIFQRIICSTGNGSIVRKAWCKHCSNMIICCCDERAVFIQRHIVNCMQVIWFRYHSELVLQATGALLKKYDMDMVVILSFIAVLKGTYSMACTILSVVSR